jgi:Pyruvate/2-oxoacid:ferredoxin oxidoreductase delta subunit
MKTDLFYYTGTGNSLWTARTLAKELGDAEVIPITRCSVNPVMSRAEAIGIIFPVHIWGLPRRVLAFVDALEPDPSRYHFAVAVNAGQVAATLLQLNKRMQARGLLLSSGFELAMPSNYIPWGGPGPEAVQIRRIAAARDKIGRIAAAVSAREKRPVEKGPLWQNIVFTGFNRLSFSRVPEMDKGFWVDEKCNTCGICKTVCPCGNIDLKAGRPVWLHHCEQCLACIQWCPQEAIQFGKKTPRYKRYHHPEVTLQEMIAAATRPAKNG